MSTTRSQSPADSEEATAAISHDAFLAAHHGATSFDSLPLRERKRIKTLAAIQDKATALVLDRGFDNVTVEDICQEAGISRRTLFNYVDSKEAAVMGPGPRALTAAETHEFCARRHEDVLTAIVHLTAKSTGLFDACPGFQDKDSWDAAAILLKRRKRIMLKNPGVTIHQLSSRQESYHSILDTVTAYYERFPDMQVLTCPARQEACIAVALVIGALQLGLHEWMASPDDSLDTLLTLQRSALRNQISFAAQHSDDTF